MPIYSYECNDCKKQFDSFASIAERSKTKCQCGGATKIIFNFRGAAHGDEMEPTKHPITGEIFTSKAKFREVTRRHGCTEIGNEEVDLSRGPEVDKRAEADFERRTWAYLNGEGQERVREINNRMEKINDEYRSRRNRR